MTQQHTLASGDTSLTIDHAPIHPSVGAVVTGVNIKDVGEREAAEIEALFRRHGALLFREQDLGPDDLTRFSRLFGSLDEAPVNEKGKTALDGYPHIYVVSNILGPNGEPIGSLGAGEAVWHTDMSYLECPPRASMLYAMEIPESGGNTWLAGMEAALKEMPDDLRSRVEGRRIKHDATYNSGGYLRQGVVANDDPTTSHGTFHPVILTHPSTGREVLYLGRRRNAYVEGLARDESETLLDELWAHATAPRFTYAHEWHVGDLLMWDNQATVHRRDPFDPDARRYMLRTQIQGVRRLST